MNTQPNNGSRGKAFAPRHINIVKLLHARQQPARQTGLDVLLENARREAAALAWSTGYPFLVLPALTEELESDARTYWSKQTYIRQEFCELLHRTFPVTTRRLAA